jgi:nucleoside-diphosphate-sugar epimerase
LCEIAFARVELDYRDFVIGDARFARPAEIDHLLGDPSTARDELGWTPKVDFRELVEMMVDADMERAPAQLPGGLRPKGTRVRVLVTGSNGFVGRWLTAELEAHGHEVVPTDASLDIRDGDAVSQPRQFSPTRRHRSSRRRFLRP